MNRLLNSENEVVTIIGGATSYITVNPGISAIVDGTTRVTLPVTYDMADFRAAISAREIGGRKEVNVLRGDNAAVIIKINPDDTVNTAPQQFLCVLELQAVLTQDVPNSLYKEGDTLAFLWSFFIERAVVFE